MSDFIRREDALNKFEKACTFDSVDKNGMKRGEIKTALTWEGIREILETIPSAEPEKKKGKWIHKEYFIGACYAECNKCHQHTRGIAEDNGFGFNYKFYNFCPHCGADMRGE